MELSKCPCIYVIGGEWQIISWVLTTRLMPGRARKTWLIIQPTISIIFQKDKNKWRPTLFKQLNPKRWSLIHGHLCFFPLIGFLKYCRSMRIKLGCPESWNWHRLVQRLVASYGYSRPIALCSLVTSMFAESRVTLWNSNWEDVCRGSAVKRHSKQRKCPNMDHL